MKFKINATMNTISILETEVEASDLTQATMIALQNSKKEDWVTKKELKTMAK